MKKKNSIFITGLLVLCLMLTLGLAGCGSKKQEAAPADQESEADDGYIGSEKAEEIALEAAAKDTGKDVDSLIALDLTLDDELGEKYTPVGSEGEGTPVYAFTIEDKVYIIDAVSGELLEAIDAPEGAD